MNKPKIPRETTLVTVGISSSQWGSLLQGDQNNSYKVDATELFLFFFETKVEHSLKAVASLPDVLFVTQSFLPFLGEERGIAWRVRRGSRRALLALRAHALSGSPFFRYFKDDTSILFYFILFLSFFFFNLFIFCSQLAARVFPTFVYQLTSLFLFFFSPNKIKGLAWKKETMLGTDYQLVKPMLWSLKYQQKFVSSTEVYPTNHGTCRI